MMRRNYKGYTRFVKQKVQSYFDIQTSTLAPTVIQFNAGGNDLLARLPAFFQGFKYFKVSNLKVTAVPQSTLPVDPTGLSYQAGEQTVDPRDQLTPGLIRITNGEDLRPFSTGINPSARDEYNSMMLDPRWYKFMLQTGFKRSCTPRFWGVGQLRQDAWPGQVVNVAQDGATPLEKQITSHDVLIRSDVGDASVVGFDGTSDLGLFQTGQMVRSGWLPTDSYQWAGVDNPQGGVHDVVEIPCITAILPQVYKTNYYYRVFVTETVLFKDPIVYSGFPGSQDIVQTGIDRQIIPVIKAGNYADVVTPGQPKDNDGSYGL